MIKTKKHRVGIVVNGELPGIERLRELWRSVDVVMSTDGAANGLVGTGCVPHIVIGDLDSIEPPVRESLEPISEIIPVSCQESTDLEKAVRLALERGAKEIVVTGSGGGRLDHALTNMAVLSRFCREIPIRLIEPSGYGVLLAADGSETMLDFTGAVGRIVSLIPLGSVEQVYTEGLRYPLLGEPLVWGEREGQSNEAVAERIVVSIRRGVLFVFSDRPIELTNDEHGVIAELLQEK